LSREIYANYSTICGGILLTNAVDTGRTTQRRNKPLCAW